MITADRFAPDEPPPRAKASAMLRFAQTARAVAETPSKLEKVALVAAYLRELDDADLGAATRFFTGNPFPQRDERRLAVGGRTIVAAAHALWGFSSEALREAYRATGDLGEALGRLYRPSLDLGLFRVALRPGIFAALLDEIAAASGRAAQRRRRHLCERILGSCTAPLEVTYVVKILTGELRIGLRAGLVIDALAAAFERTDAEIRRAVAATGDVGAVAIAARDGTLSELGVAYGVPIAFMLASPIPYGSYRDLAGGTWLVEDKYDGIRIQAHKLGERVALFSRTLSDVAASFPEIVDALRALPGDFVLDGEIVAERDGRILPFRYLQTRLQRKDVSAELRANVPVAFVGFDLLAREAEFVIHAPLETRRETLRRILPDAGTARLAPSAPLGAAPADDEIAERFAAARARGNEGLVFKRAGAAYVPGKRGKWWLKLKRELSTLDVVVVAVEWGHGRRAQMLSDVTFAVRGPGGEPLVIGKAYSGLTDAEIAALTEWFLAHRLPEREAAETYARLGLRRAEIPVEPTIVLEVAFDVVQRSTLHRSGYALRFPRIVRLRPDKPAAEIDTLESVAAIYAAMLEREGISV